VEGGGVFILWIALELLNIITQYLQDLPETTVASRASESATLNLQLWVSFNDIHLAVTPQLHPAVLLEVLPAHTPWWVNKAQLKLNALGGSIWLKSVLESNPRVWLPLGVYANVSVESDTSQRWPASKFLWAAADISSLSEPGVAMCRKINKMHWGTYCPNKIISQYFITVINIINPAWSPPMVVSKIPRLDFEGNRLGDLKSKKPEGVHIFLKEYYCLEKGSRGYFGGGDLL